MLKINVLFLISFSVHFWRYHQKENFTSIINSFHLRWSLGIYFFFYIFPICYNLRRQRNIRKLCRTLASDVRKSSLIWLLLIPGSFLRVSIKLVSCMLLFDTVWFMYEVETLQNIVDYKDHPSIESSLKNFLQDLQCCSWK